MANLAELKAFDFDNADLTVWVYKKSTRAGVPVFNGHWVGITDALAASLREAVSARLGEVNETIEYDILAQNNESSVLTLGADETHIALVEAQSANPTEGRKAKRLKQLANSAFYMVRFASEMGALLAVRKTDASWKTRKSANALRVVFSDEELDVDDRPTFTLEPMFDFFVFNESIYVTHKGRFESVLAYKAGHLEAFEELVEEPDFSSIFS